MIRGITFYISPISFDVLEGVCIYITSGSEFDCHGDSPTLHLLTVSMVVDEMKTLHNHIVIDLNEQAKELANPSSHEYKVNPSWTKVKFDGKKSYARTWDISSPYMLKKSPHLYDITNDDKSFYDTSSRKLPFFYIHGSHGICFASVLCN